MLDIAIFGGGASGYFTAAIAGETNPQLNIAVYEKSNKTLAKVKVSGGGRCNVTHACFEQKELVKNYPRGERELLGPFHAFMTFDTIAWFENNGVPLKTEEDGRMFPQSNSSESIIECLTTKLKQLNIPVHIGEGLVDFEKTENGFLCKLTNGSEITAKNIVLCTGSSEMVWQMLSKHGITIVPPVPSLFTFNVKNTAFNQLMGLSIPNAQVSIDGLSTVTNGPLLFTHWGLSGPAVLKLSAFAARYLAEKNYVFNVKVNFTGTDPDDFWDELLEMQQNEGQKTCRQASAKFVPKRLHEVLMAEFTMADKKMAEIKKETLKNLHQLLTSYVFEANGKTTFKEEFVTAGGVDLKEVNMKTLESKKIPGLYFAGECLNIDAITGGFNFQAAWTTGYLAGKAMAE